MLRYLTLFGCIALVATMLASQGHAAEPGAENMTELDCVIEPYEVIEVSSAAEGVIERIHVERNDFVTRGQILAELESDVEKASLAFAQFNASLNSEIGLRRASLQFDQRNQSRVEALYTKRVIPLHQKEEVETDATKSHWLLKKAQDDKRLAALELARANAVVKRKTVRSPITGVVVARHKSTGEYIEDQPVVTVAQLDPLRVEVIAPVDLFGRIHSGMRAEIVPELATTGPFEAKVMSVDRVIDGASGTFDVRLELPNPDYAIPSGLKCRLAFADVPATPEFNGIDVAPPPVDASGPVAQPKKPVRPPAPQAQRLTETNKAQPAKSQDNIVAQITQAIAKRARNKTSNASDGSIKNAPDISAVISDPLRERNTLPVVSVKAREETPHAKPPRAAKTVRSVVAAPAKLPATTPAVEVSKLETAPPRQTVANATSISSKTDKASLACSVIGPLETRTDVDRLRSALNDLAVQISAIKKMTPVTHSYILASRPLANTVEKKAVTNLIAQHGIKDTALLRKGAHRGRYSFGVYSKHRIARAKYAELSKLGFDLELIPRVRQRSRTWLQVRPLNQSVSQANLIGAGKGVDNGLTIEATACSSPAENANRSAPQIAASTAR